SWLRIKLFVCLCLCLQGDYYFEYTECDSTGSRWRVAIPQRPGECTGLPDPVQGTDCSFSCAAGEFLEMSAQECTQCAAGSYSLGSGIRFDEWDDIPRGFSSVATYLDNTPHGQQGPSCNGSSWIAQGSYVESNRDECSVSLVYAVHLKKQGSVSFEYQYVDNNIFFEFFIQNDQCQEMEKTSDQKWIKLTSNGQWSKHTVSLKSGTNVLYWRTTGVTVGAKIVKPVLLKNIQIEGVAYMSECLPCKPGTFSKSPGSSSCELCPRNTYSGRGASSCTPCNTTTHYALEGSSVCKARPACSKKDYFQIHSVCDEEGKTQIIYKWIEPKICLEEVPDAVTLPPSGEREPCPPCNPGFYNNNTATCLPCPQGTYSDGLKECQPCPAGTEPALGYEYKWWNILPANMKSSCFNVANTKCDGMNGWEVAGDHIRSGAGGSDNDYLILNLKVPGFSLSSLAQPVCHALLSALPTPSSQDTTCMAETRLNHTLQFDFSSLGSTGSIMNGPSFTSKGTKYYHLFNISLCGLEAHRPAVCSDNVTDLSDKDPHGSEANKVEAFICQSTVIPSDGRGFRVALSSQSTSLADSFLGESPQTTSSCENGRNTVVTLRCSPEKTAKGEISVPRQCPAGTCDGCTFHFLWESSSACPCCTEADYHQIEGACKGGVQDTVYVWTEPRLCTGGVGLPVKRSTPCEMIDFWLKVGAGVGAFCAVLLVSLTCYFWKKNKKLEFKYSKLVMSTNKECELPAADSCAIMEGEGEEVEDEVVYSKPSLLGKLKAIATKVYNFEAFLLAH
uniref:Si:ch211-233h19.2 n=1 Tax=Astyanax mexicanus TaxID=7994 RepID=A0A8B9K4W9_ASTMX